MSKASDLKIKIFADGADKSSMLEMYEKPFISGFTTNPTLMRKAGVEDYRSFAHEMLEAIPDRPISFEVFADEMEEMETQALEIQSWGENVYVKIPVTNTKGEPTYDLINRLSEKNVKLNVTAILALEQVREVAFALKDSKGAVVSVFAGRIADTGVDPIPVMQAALELLKLAPNAELLWASPRELLNVIQADSIGCHIITATPDVLKKLESLGKDLKQFSLETVQMFYNDATKVGYTI